MADLSVNIAGVALKNPLIAASGAFGFGEEYSAFIPSPCLAAFPAKGLHWPRGRATRRRALRRRPAACLTRWDCKTRAWIAFWSSTCPGCGRRTRR